MNHHFVITIAILLTDKPSGTVHFSSEAQRKGRLTNTVEGDFLPTEERAAIPIDLIHVVTLFTLVSTERIWKENLSQQLQEPNRTRKSPLGARNVWLGLGQVPSSPV